jgi:hypothetical protein
MVDKVIATEAALQLVALLKTRPGRFLWKGRKARRFTRARGCSTRTNWKIFAWLN